MVRTDEHLYDELKPLKKEVARLTEERDVLKKSGCVLCQRTTVGCMENLPGTTVLMEVMMA
jgi:transposase